MVSYFLLFEGTPAKGYAALRRAFRDRYEMILKRLPGAGSILVYSPEDYTDPMLKDDPGPALLVRVHFPTYERFESAFRLKVPVLDFKRFIDVAGFEGRVRDEVMEETHYPVDRDPSGNALPGAVSYFVLYQGPAQNRSAFISYYKKNHPPLLGKLPGNHATILYSPTDKEPPLGIVHAGHMLICDVSFDSTAALNAALASQVRVDLRADYQKFPKFDGPVTHQAMTKFVIKN